MTQLLQNINRKIINTASFNFKLYSIFSNEGISNSITFSKLGKVFLQKDAALSISCMGYHPFIKSSNPGIMSGKTQPFFNFIEMLHTSTKVLAKGAIKKEKKTKGGKPTTELSDEEMNQVILVDPYRADLQKIVDNFKEHLFSHFSLHTGSVGGGIESLLIKWENNEYLLSEMCQISRKNPSLVALNLSSFPECIKPVCDQLHNSGMTTSVQQEGTMLYVHLPKVTREHRENMVKSASEMLNKTKVEFRQVQNTALQDVKNKRGFSEDLIFNVQQHIQYIANMHMKKAEDIFNSKKKELLQEK